MLGYGTFITMDFGKDIEIVFNTKKGIEKFTRGEWHLWINDCAWRIDKEGKPIIGSNDDRKKINKKILILKNKILKNIEILSNIFDAKISFEKGIELTLFANTTEEAEHWMLFTPDRKVLTAGPGTKISYKLSNK